MSEGARAGSIPMVCPAGHIMSWAARAVYLGVPQTQGCSASGCGMPQRRLAEDEEAAYRLDGPPAVTMIMHAKYGAEIAAWRLGGMVAIKAIHVGELPWPWANLQ